jgi:hypothetical protein
MKTKKAVYDRCMKNTFLACFVIIFIFPLTIFAAGHDSIPPVLKPFHKNIIKFNPTPMLWNTRNVTLGYERLVTWKQSVSLQIGYFVLPQLTDEIANLVSITSRQKAGVNIVAEYRFYQSRLNRRPTPAGLYIGPYFSYYGYTFKNGLKILNTNLLKNGMLKGKYNIFNLGFELGYQFVFWKRFTIDLILIGPSLSYYFGRTDISGDLSLDETRLVNSAVYDKLNERFALDKILSFNKSFKSGGKLETFAVGYRYLIQFGVHF